MGGEEMHFVKEAFESNYIAPLGPIVVTFERKFAEVLERYYFLATARVS